MGGWDKTVVRLDGYVDTLKVYGEIQILGVMVMTEILRVDSWHCKDRDNLQWRCVELHRK